MGSAPATVTETQVCRKCRVLKPLSQFVASKSAPNGYSRLCLECKRQENYEYLERKRQKQQIAKQEEIVVPRTETLIERMQRAIDAVGGIPAFARRLGMVDSTVAYALKNPMGITPRTRKKIETAVEEILHPRKNGTVNGTLNGTTENTDEPLVHEKVDHLQSIRKCAKCLADKPLIHFDANPNEPDGYSRYCRTCEDMYGETLLEQVDLPGQSELPTLDAPADVTSTDTTSPSPESSEPEDHNDEQTIAIQSVRLSDKLLDLAGLVAGLEKAHAKLTLEYAQMYADTKEMGQKVQAEKQAEIDRLTTENARLATQVKTLNDELDLYREMEAEYKRRDDEVKSLQSTVESQKTEIAQLKRALAALAGEK